MRKSFMCEVKKELKQIRHGSKNRSSMALGIPKNSKKGMKGGGLRDPMRSL